MKTNLKNILGVAALGVTLLATTVPTWAGLVSTERVTIGSTQFSLWASGSLVGARYSADTSREQIGCRTQTLPYYSWTSCHAMDSAGRSLICGSAENRFHEMVRAMTDSSHIFFETTDSSNNPGVCRNIMIYDGSDMLK